MKYDITIAILVFHPDIEKTLLTIHSVLYQKDVSIEVLICDDGSEVIHDDLWEATFTKYHFRDFKILNSVKNEGTVRNCLKAAENAAGKYLFLTSPGDLLYDEYTLKRFFEFAEKGSHTVCFGNAISYQNDLENSRCIILEKENHMPEKLGLYKKKNKKKLQKLDFFLEDNIIGASYFRKTEGALEAFKRIAKTAKYMEDKTSTMYFLLKGEKIAYLDSSVVWYEYGNGISTSKKEKWAVILDEDLMKTAESFRQDYQDPYLDFFLGRRKKGRKGLVLRALKHPVLFLMQIDLNMNPQYRYFQTESETGFLKKTIEKIYEKEFVICRL